MRAKPPRTEGKIDRDGIKIHYEVYGQGDHTILFIPTWSLVHSRAYKAQIPYFSEHFRYKARALSDTFSSILASPSARTSPKPSR